MGEMLKEKDRIQWGLINLTSYTGKHFKDNFFFHGELYQYIKKPFFQCSNITIFSATMGTRRCFRKFKNPVKIPNSFFIINWHLVDIFKDWV